MNEDNFQQEAPAATRDMGYQAQDQIQPFFQYQCRRNRLSAHPTVFLKYHKFMTWLQTEKKNLRLLIQFLFLDELRLNCICWEPIPSMPHSLFRGHALERSCFIFVSEHNRPQNGFLSTAVQSLGISGHSRLYKRSLQCQPAMLLNPQMFFTFQFESNTETNKKPTIAQK